MNTEVKEDEHKHLHPDHPDHPHHPHHPEHPQHPAVEHS